MDFTDLASRYLQTRMDQATQPFTDPSAYMNQRLGLDTSANVQPKSTTITYNDDGSQTVTEKKDVTPPAQQPQFNFGINATPQPPQFGLNPAMPPVAQAPTPMPPQAGPVPGMMPPQAGPVPGMMPPQAGPQPGMMPVGATRQALMTPPAAGPAGTSPIISDTGQVLGNETPQQMVQGAQTNAPIAPVAPAPAPQLAPQAGPAPAGPVAPAPQMTPAVAPAVQAPPTPMPAPIRTRAQADSDIIKAQTSPEEMFKIANDQRPLAEGGYDDHQKQLASQWLADYYSGESKKNKETKKADELIANNDERGIARVLTSKDSEGSYLKAYLYNRLGLSHLAQQEEIKLGAGSTLQRVMLPDNTTALVRLRGDNVATYGVDTVTGKELSADQLAMASAGYAKGTDTGKSLFRTRDGHIVTVSTVPGRIEPIFYDNTEKKQLERAPQGMTPLGQKDPTVMAGLESKKQVETALRKENNKAGGRLYSEEQIQSLGSNAFKSIVGYDYNAREHGVVSPQEEAAQGAPGAPSTTQANLNAGNKSVTGQAEFNDPSIRIISAQRPTSQQQTMYDESVTAGRPGRTAEGNPIAKPGTSLHETNNARDIDSKALTKAGRQELYNKGWYQPIPQQDPNHWERIGNAPAKEAPGTTSGINKNIESSAQSIAEYHSKPVTAGGQQGPYNQAVMARVRELNPDYDESKWDTAKKTRQMFTTGKQGDTVRSMNVAVDHLDTLDKAATALNNGELPILNKIMNDFSRNTGHPAVTNFEGIKSIVGSEVAKAVSGAGGSALGDREEIRKEISSANSPAQLAGVIKKYQELMAGQLKGLKLQYEDSGLKDFDKKIAEPTKRVMGRIEQENKNTRSTW